METGFDRRGRAALKWGTVAALDDNFVHELKARVPIEDLAGRYTQLKRAGRNWVGLSPFTNEKTPSFNVLPEKGIFKCFSSGIAGDAISLVREKEKMEFVEAVEYIAKLYNIPVRYREGSTAAPVANRTLRREIEEIHDYAAEFFHRTLMGDSAEAGAVRQYWVEARRFDLEVARAFRIGFSPVTGFDLNKLLIDKGFSVEALAQSGLFYVNERDRNANRFRPRFRGRLMIPIRDAQNQIVAFTARQLPQTPEDDPTAKAKYVNSPESPIFHKSRLLFNLERAREAVDDDTPFLMVEGQLDAIRCWTLGFRAAVAPQGTSVTEEQLRLLRRYQPRVDILLDGDAAGQKAALRIVPLAFAAQIEPRFVSLPKGADPDTFLLEKGPEALKALCEGGAAIIPFAVGALTGESTPSATERGVIIRTLADYLKSCESQVARAAYLEEAAELLGADPLAALADARRIWSRRAVGPAATGASAAPPPDDLQNPESAGFVKKRLTEVEEGLLWIILLDARWAPLLAETIHHEWLDVSSPVGRILGRIFAEVEEGNWEGLQQVDALLETSEERSAFYDLQFREAPDDFDSGLHARECVGLLLQQFIRRRRQALTQAIARVGLDAREAARLLRERKELVRLAQTLPSLDHLHLEPESGSAVPS